MEVIARNARREIRLVEDLLAVAAVCAGDVATQQGSVDMTNLVRHAVEEAKPVAQNAHVTLSVETSNDAGVVQGDQDRLGHAISNVLSNAIKFTRPGGRVTVQVGSRPGSPTADSGCSEEQLHVVVTDDGAGIEAADRSRIFEQFHRGCAAVAEEKQGVGLGLTVVKAVVEAHGGSLAVRSGANAGTQVEIAFPVAPAQDSRSSGRLADESPRSSPVARSTARRKGPERRND